MRGLRVGLGAAVLALALAACGAGQPAPGPSSTTGTSAGPLTITAGSATPTAPQPAGTTALPEPPAPASNSAWPTTFTPVADTVVPNPDGSQPSNPVMFAIQTAPHDTYDRIVFDLKGRVPGRAVSYVNCGQLKQEPSDQPVTLHGAHTCLEIKFKPAQGYWDDGSLALPNAQRQGQPGQPELASYAVTEDYEGYMTVDLGLSSKTQTGFQVGAIPGQTTTRVYVDVHH